MELLVIILVLVYSVWSEVNKKKQEENVDIDFSEIASLDDFFKDSGSSTPPKAVAKPSAHKQKKKSRPNSSAAGGAVNYDDYSGLTGQFNYERSENRQKKNYDELPQLSGVTNYDRMSSSDRSNGDHLSEQDRKMFELGRQDQSQPNIESPITISFDRNSFIKAFVMSEVLQRYDIERIYARIPGINQPPED
ncbi:MAG: hypothetical protein CVV42_00210 [Candidatus Riflebacteria bacterium HGW-Riflebacteria-2]|jgi:E3 ubiquitin-protein ligase DOA10|nr:MAG: hypothetical protein CVV42_00210 [Candidatus Riflebacteria bacterium HGW-Riflebacteria-2]